MFDLKRTDGSSWPMYSPSSGAEESAHSESWDWHSGSHDAYHGPGGNAAAALPGRAIAPAAAAPATVTINERNRITEHSFRRVRQGLPFGLLVAFSPRLECDGLTSRTARTTPVGACPAVIP